MQIIRFSVNDKLLMKKKHPCGSSTFNVTRIGSDIKIVCTGCGRDLTLARETLEKMIKKVLQSESAEE